MNLVLSVDDTNKLRAQVGLKLIPVEGNGKKSKSIHIDDNISEISIEETNKIRKKLGLKLIPEFNDSIVTNNIYDGEFINYQKLNQNRLTKDKIENLHANLNKAKNDLKNQQRMNQGGILDRLDGNSNNVMDFDSWLDKVGTELKKDGVKKKLSFKNGDKKNNQKNLDDNINDKIVISHNKKKFDEMMMKDKGVVLTLKDTNVLDDASEDEDIFENRDLKMEENLSKNLNEGKQLGKLVTLEKNDEKLIGDSNFDESNGFVLHEYSDKLSEDDDKNINKKRKFISLDIDLSDSDNDNATGIDFDANESHKKTISKFMKRDISKFKKSKKSKSNNEQGRVRKFDTELIEKEYKPVKLDHDDDGIDELGQILEVTRQSNLKKRKVDLNLDLDLDDTKISNSTGEIIDENIEFLNNFNTDNLDDDKGDEKSSEITTKSFKTNIEVVETKNESRYRAILTSENDKNYNTYGVSDMLNILKSGNKVSANNANKSKDVQLVYTDDDGKVLNTKEAFKYLSHKFHGSKKR